MNEKESADLDRRLRENKGRLQWPEFAQALIEALPEYERNRQRLSLAATDSLRASFFKRVAAIPTSTDERGTRPSANKSTSFSEEQRWHTQATSMSCSTISTG